MKAQERKNINHLKIPQHSVELPLSPTPMQQVKSLRRMGHPLHCHEQNVGNKEALSRQNMSDMLFPVVILSLKQRKKSWIHKKKYIKGYFHLNLCVVHLENGPRHNIHKNWCLQQLQTCHFEFRCSWPIPATGVLWNMLHPLPFIR